MINRFLFLPVFLFLSFHPNFCKAQSFTKNLITNNYNSWSTFAIDLDTDGDMDIVGSSRLSSKIAWWENNGEEVFTEHVVSYTATYAMGISADDMDGDLDIDIVCAVQEADAVIWWENDGNQVFTQHIAAEILSPSFIYLEDVDNDQDQDILVAACEDGSNKIVWMENTGASIFTSHIIKENWDHANSIYATDMDLDNDMDILATASLRTATPDGEISWFENDGNQNFTEHTIISDYGKPSCAIASDMDNDDDTDVIAAICQLNQIVLFENDGAQNFTPEIISNNFFRPHSLFAADIDNDDDLDILGAAINLNQIAWFENNDLNFTKHVVSNAFGGASCVLATHIDDDNDLDILGTAQFANEIAWWENSLITGIEASDSFEVNSHEIHCYPNPFQFSSKINCKLSENAQVLIEIFDSKGQRMKMLLDEYQVSGKHCVIWDGKDDNGQTIPAGLFFCTITIGGKTSFNKIILIR